MSSFALTLATPALIALLPVAQAHMAMWAESMYGFSQPYEPVVPLSGKPFSEWWFHGNANDQPAAVTTLIPGGDLDVEIACRKEYTSFGGSPSEDACPGDSGAFHAGGTTNAQSGWSGNQESNLMGCALAIAFKPSASQTNPEDFTVMSIQENCVRQRNTNFKIPNNLPACPEGGCTCAWFWQGKNSAEEMYMTGFRCNVQGGSATGYPTPVPPRKGQISGPTQPMYWANTPTNLDYTPDWGTKPSYNAAWGWTNGAQTSAFGASGSAPGGGQGSTNSTAGAGTSAAGGAGQDPSSAAGGYKPSTSAYYAPTASASKGYGGEDGDYTPTTSVGQGYHDGGGEYAPTTSAGYGGENDEYAEPTSTRRRPHRPTSSASAPPWQELVADPANPEIDDEEGAGEIGLVQEPKKCNRHSKRRSRIRARKAHSS